MPPSVALAGKSPHAGSKRRLLRRKHKTFKPIIFQGDLPDLPSRALPSWTLNGRLRSASRIILFIFLTLCLMPVQMMAKVIKWRRLATRLPFFYHRAICHILGVRMVVRGAPKRGGAVLFVANHCSWLDIPVFSSLAPVSFVAKSEVGTWPLFGFLAKLQRTIFVARDQRLKTGDARDNIASRLGEGDNLILFPEGTSSDGNRILPFKSALFGAAETRIATGTSDSRPVTVQPITISYTRLDGMPMGRGHRPFFTWYGDMELIPHLLSALSFGSITVEIDIHPPITVDEAGGRKRLAQICEDLVRAGHSRALQGRAI